LSAEATGLRGLRVVLTRPAGQNEALADAIAAAGGMPVLFPVLEIAEVADPAPFEAAVARLADYDLAIFISPNATRRAMRLIGTWPTGLRAATIGPASAEALREHGVEEALFPRVRYDSEALLESAELQDMRGKRVVIFCGEGGRDLLQRRLSERGAQVDRAPCYRRVLPRIDATPLRRSLAIGEVDAIVATSSEGLRNLHAMLGESALPDLLRTPLVLPHPRIAEEARRLGHAGIVTAPPGDEGLLSALGRFSARVKHPSAQGGPPRTRKHE
jgi:uroporphyrinogen-III synthase